MRLLTSQKRITPFDKAIQDDHMLALLYFVHLKVDLILSQRKRKHLIEELNLDPQVMEHVADFCKLMASRKQSEQSRRLGPVTVCWLPSQGGVESDNTQMAALASCCLTLHTTNINSNHVSSLKYHQKSYRIMILMIQLRLFHPLYIYLKF